MDDSIQPAAEQGAGKRTVGQGPAEWSARGLAAGAACGGASAGHAAEDAHPGPQRGQGTGRVPLADVASHRAHGARCEGGGDRDGVDHAVHTAAARGVPCRARRVRRAGQPGHRHRQVWLPQFQERRHRLMDRCQGRRRSDAHARPRAVERLERSGRPQWRAALVAGFPHRAAWPRHAAARRCRRAQAPARARGERAFRTPRRPRRKPPPLSPTASRPRSIRWRNASLTVRASLPSPVR